MPMPMGAAAAATYAHYADTDDSDAEEGTKTLAQPSNTASCDPNAPPTVHALDRQLMKTTEHRGFASTGCWWTNLLSDPLPAPRHLERLADAGIKAVFSLCGEEERLPRRISAPLCTRTSRSPITERPPTSGKELQTALQLLKLHHQHGAVYVHCVAAMERSPLVCLAWLVKQRHLKPARALDYLMQVHPGTNPLPGQLAYWKLVNANCLDAPTPTQPPPVPRWELISEPVLPVRATSQDRRQDPSQPSNLTRLPAKPP